MPRSWPAKFVLCCLGFALLFAATPTALPAQVNITVSFGPPAIPYYVQPSNPTPNDIWSPGYWAYDSPRGGYYWVPGTWVPAPAYGQLWTPGYWAWNGRSYVWTPGYWAQSVGYYGGVNYGYGYYGRGYVGGRWRGHEFEYNTAVTHVDRDVRNVYVNRTVVVHDWNRVSYNGGRGGIVARPTPNELAARQQRRIAPTPVQVRHQQAAAQNRTLFSHVNRGRPPIAAVPRPLTSTPQRRVPQAQQHAAPPQTHVAAPRNAAPAHVDAAPPVRAAPVKHQPTAHVAAPQMHAPTAHTAAGTPTAHSGKSPDKNHP